MSREYQLKSAEKFIGKADFGFTRDSVEKFFSEIRKELERIKELNGEFTPFSLGVPDEDRKEDTGNNLEQPFKEMPSFSLGGFITDREKEINDILNQSPENILVKLKEIYDFICKLEEEGMAREQILQKIKNERPELLENLNKFYGLARKQKWGYELGQGLTTVD